MELKCEFKVETYDGVQYYTCVVKEVSITKPFTNIKEIIGKHQPGKIHKDVEAIKFLSTTVHYVPRGLDKIFPALKVLDIENCGLLSIAQNDFHGLQKLEVLNLSQNQLQWLPSNLLVGMTKLKCISFYNNKLERVSSKLLEPIASNPLKFVSFMGNAKIDNYFGPGYRGGTKSLQELMKIIDASCAKPDAKEEGMLGQGYDEQEFDRDFKNGFKDLWDTKNFSDFIIVIGSKEFAVHKNVLATQSSVFTAIFLNDMKEKQTRKMEIEDFAADVVEGMLKFMYTGKLKDEKHAMDLFAIAVKYEVKNLKRVTENLILHNLDESNALEVFGLGHLHNSDVLKRRGFAVIQSMFPGKDLPDSLMEKPEELRELIEEARKFQEAQAKLQTKLKKFKKGD
jgi:BTB/POZ domain/Leucine rich repeat